MSKSKNKLSFFLSFIGIALPIDTLAISDYGSTKLSRDFHRYDRNGDMALQLDEWKEYAYRSIIDKNSETNRVLFEMDRDLSNTISKDEFDIFINQHGLETIIDESILYSWGSNQANVIYEAPKSDFIVDVKTFPYLTTFNSIDTNKDGHISRSEFFKLKTD
ncbi:hypothetical protein BS028_15865 [Vibrio parahaemolyticus]|nr:hypothetical protein [Vibrio parahaemolyticus]